MSYTIGIGESSFKTGDCISGVRMGSLTWCPWIVKDGVGRRGGRLEGLEEIGVKRSDDSFAGSIHSDRLGGVDVGVST